MRLRIQCDPPLSVSKFWFPFDPEAPLKILKKSLCSTAPALKDRMVTPDGFTLEMDGFELLEELPLNGILREGDLLVIKLKVNSKKRKADAIEPVHKKRAKLSSSSSSESSSDSSDSSDDSSDDSSSEDESSSDSSDSSAPKSIPIAKKPPPRQTSNRQHVPPGQGLAQTQSRNQRRRLKKLHDKALASGVPLQQAAPPPPPKNLSSANAQDISPEDADLSLHMFSMGNKNKKKGYKQALVHPTGSKIVFEVPSVPVVAPTSPPVVVASSQNSYRFIPPSERSDLPRNMFVTSVDVEEGMWTKSKKKRRQSSSKANPQDESMVVDEHTTTLDYGEPEVPVSQDEKIWADADASFDVYPLAPAVLNSQHVAGILAWKELSLNPATFSPEIMLQLARILTVSADVCTIQKLVRPGFEDEDGPPPTEEITLSTISSNAMKFIATA